MRALRVSVWIAMVACSGHALAQGEAPLNVTRGEGTGDCPDAAGLTARIEEIRKSPARADQPPYEVTFARDEHGVYAQIASVQTGAERVLTDTSPDCVALAQATSVTLALLFDADAQALEQPPAPPPPQPPEPPPPIAPPPRDPANVHRLNVNYGAGALTGVIAPIGFAGSIAFEYVYGSWRASLGGMLAVAPPHELGSGRVVESLMGLTLGGCYAPWRQGLWRFDLCPGLIWGSVTGTARGLAEGRSSERGWFAPTAETRLALLPDQFGFELSAAMLVPAMRHDFAIEGTGIAYRSSPVAFQIALHLTWCFTKSGP